MLVVGMEMKSHTTTTPSELILSFLADKCYRCRVTINFRHNDPKLSIPSTQNAPTTDHYKLARNSFLFFSLCPTLLNRAKCKQISHWPIIVVVRVHNIRFDSRTNSKQKVNSIDVYLIIVLFIIV